jgi:hypothetical protein
LIKDLLVVLFSSNFNFLLKKLQKVKASFSPIPTKLLINKIMGKKGLLTFKGPTCVLLLSCKFSKQMKNPTNKSLLSVNGPTCVLLLLCKLSKQMKNEKLTT